MDSWDHMTIQDAIKYKQDQENNKIARRRLNQENFDFWKQQAKQKV